MTTETPQNYYADLLFILANLNNGEVYGYTYYTDEADRVRVVAIAQGIANPDLIFNVLIQCAELQIRNHPNVSNLEQLLETSDRKNQGRGR